MNEAVIPPELRHKMRLAGGRAMERVAGTVDVPVVEAIVEAAMRCLGENPIVPTEAQTLEMLQERVESGHLSGEEYCAIPATTVQRVIEAWMRRALAPEPETYAAPPFIRDAGLKAGEGLFSSSGKPLAIWNGDGLIPWNPEDRG